MSERELFDAMRERKERERSKRFGSFAKEEEEGEGLLLISSPTFCFLFRATQVGLATRDG